MCIVKSKDISPEIRPWNILWKHLKPIKHTVKRQCRVSASLLAYFVKAACNVFCPPSWIWYNEEVLRWPQVFRLQQPFLCTGYPSTSQAAWQALETPRRTDGMKRKRLKLEKNDSTWNANRNNNIMQFGSGLSMANCLSLPILLSIFGPMVHILEKEVKNCRNSMLLGLLHITSYGERENNLFLSYPAITDTKSSPRGFPQ